MNGEDPRRGTRPSDGWSLTQFMTEIDSALQQLLERCTLEGACELEMLKEARSYVIWRALQQQGAQRWRHKGRRPRGRNVRQGTINAAR